MQNLTTQQKALLEEELIDALIAWKKKTDAMAGDIAAARDAMAKAHKYRIWEGKYESFKEWLDKECGISKAWAYAMIGAARTIDAIEDSVQEAVDGSEIADKEGAVEVVKNTVRKLPHRTLKKLENLKPLKAAAVLAEEIVAKANSESIEQRIIDRIGEVIGEKVATNSPSQMMEISKVLEVIDAEWATMKQAAAYVALTPEGVYSGLRRAIVSAQAKK